ncbi:unnamed protein product [Parajaminaea phylloscopi]
MKTWAAVMVLLLTVCSLLAPVRSVTLSLSIRSRGQITKDHTGRILVSKEPDASGAAIIRFPLAMQWQTFKRMIEERVTEEVGVVCNVEDLTFDLTVSQTRCGTLVWSPRSERAYKELQIVSPDGSCDLTAKGVATYVPPVLLQPPPSPPPVPSPIPSPHKESSSRTSSGGSMTSRERAAEAWDNNKAIKHRIMKQNPPCASCSRAKHPDSRCYVDEQQIHHTITPSFMHHWADSIRTGKSGYNIHELDTYLLDRLFDLENLPSQPNKDPHTVRRREAARAVIGRYPRNVLGAQAIPNIPTSPRASPSTSAAWQTSAAAAASPFTPPRPPAPERPVRPVNMSIPHLAKELQTPYDDLVTMLLKEGVYDTDVLREWLSVPERDPSTPRRKLRWELPIRSWLQLMPAVTGGQPSQSRRQIIRDVREWFNEHSIPMPGGQEDLSDGETVPETGTSREPSTAGEYDDSTQGSVIAALEQSLPGL